jgi:hypothetical protein
VKDGTPNALTFGIYPGSAVGDTGPAGPPDRPGKISQALDWLQGSPGRPQGRQLALPLAAADPPAPLAAPPPGYPKRRLRAA